MDMQSMILQSHPSPKDLIGNVSKAIAAARAKKIPVIYAVVGFRKGTPEVGTMNKSFSMVKERFANVNPEEMLKVESSLTPQDGDVTVTKRRVSAFTGSDLEVVLRAQNIRHLVLTGISTSGVVLSTVREAADKDYRLTVLSDACGDPDEEVHRLLTTKVFPRQAEVMTVEEWKK